MMNSCVWMCVDINTDQRKAVAEGNGAFFFLLFFGCPLFGCWIASRDPRPQKGPLCAHAMALCKGSLPLACGASCLWVCVFRQV